MHECYRKKSSCCRRNHTYGLRTRKSCGGCGSRRIRRHCRDNLRQHCKQQYTRYRSASKSPAHAFEPSTPHARTPPAESVAAGTKGAAVEPSSSACGEPHRDSRVVRDDEIVMNVIYTRNGRRFARGHISDIRQSIPRVEGAVIRALTACVEEQIVLDCIVATKPVIKAASTSQVRLNRVYKTRQI